MTHFDTASAAGDGHGERQPHVAVADHAEWCDPALCTVTTAADVLEGHYGRPVTVTTAHGLPRKLTVTASLYQPAEYPLAGPYVALEVRGLDADRQEVGGITGLGPGTPAARCVRDQLRARQERA